MNIYDAILFHFRFITVLQTGNFKMLLRERIQVFEQVELGGDSASLACIVRVLTADFPFISL